MQSVRKLSRIFVLLVALGLLAAACGDGDDNGDEGDGDDATTSTASGAGLDGLAATIYGGPCADATGGEVTIYSGRSESLIGPVIEAFECETGIEVGVRWADSTELALLINEEGDRTSADVFLSRSPGPVGFLEANDRLSALGDDVLALVGEENRSASGTWVGFSGRKRVLVYSTDNVSDDELPSSVFDLTDPAYAGRVAIPSTNGSFLDWFTVFRARHGDEAAEQWINDMVANGAKHYENNRSIVEAASRGEVDFGLVNHYYNYQEAIANDDHRAANHDFADDDIGSLVIITAATITSAADDRSSAEALISYLLSEPVQQYLTSETFEYPLAAGVEANPALAATSSEGVASVDFDTLGEGFALSEEIVSRSGIANQ